MSVCSRDGWCLCVAMMARVCACVAMMACVCACVAMMACVTARSEIKFIRLSNKSADIK